MKDETQIAAEIRAEIAKRRSSLDDELERLTACVECMAEPEPEPKPTAPSKSATRRRRRRIAAHPALRIECPKCGAQVGESCATPSGQKRQPHSQRTRAQLAPSSSPTGSESPVDTE